MKNKFILLAIYFFLGTFFCADQAGAYQTRIVSGEENVSIDHPEDFQIFYGELKGRENIFSIVSGTPFRLYANVLEPDVPGARNDFSMEIRKDGQTVQFLDASNFQWKNFYDSFAGDNYWKGPEYGSQVDQGKYEIAISNPENSGKFVLIVGETKTFSLGGTIGSIFLIPRIKEEFFRESLVGAYLNQTILLFAVILMSVVGLIVIIAMACCRRKKISR
jgi:hypothetical protein